MLHASTSTRPAATRRAPSPARVSPARGRLDGAPVPRRVGKRDGPDGRQRDTGLSIRFDVRARGGRVTDATERVGEPLGDLAGAIKSGDAVAESRRLHHRTIERLLDVALE